MPDPRPLTSVHPGIYDDPPATSEASTPQTRRNTLRRALQATSGLDRNPAFPRVRMPMPTSEASRRRVYVAPTTRRRLRSDSDHEDELAQRSDAAAVEPESRRRAKRRRIESSSPAQPTKSIKYGWYGQVEAGRLKLDLVSCDGGEHRDVKYPATSLAVENMLRHDKSVYCSERPHANIVLRHADDTPFCLERVFVVGPEHGFTAPVREGVVYVAMTLADLRKYIDPPPHARRSRVHSPPIRRTTDRSSRSSPERLTLADALRDPQINAALDAWPSASGEQVANGVFDLIDSNGDYYGTDFGFGRTDLEAHCDIPSFTTEPDSEPMVNSSSFDNRPTTYLEDSSPGPEDVSSQEVLDYRLQRLRHARRRFETENWSREDRWAGLNRLHGNDATSAAVGTAGTTSSLRRLDALMARSRVRDDDDDDDSPPPLLSPPTGAAEPPTATDRGDTPRALRERLRAFDNHNPEVLKKLEEYNNGAHDSNVTCAHFHIKRGKHKVAIKFDPPVSGRFILLKVWSNSTGAPFTGPSGGEASNVDVQSVIATGFGGCRFFPAVSVR